MVDACGDIVRVISCDGKHAAVRRRKAPVGRIGVGGADNRNAARKCRIDQAAKFVPLEQLCLSPQCGFASTEEGNILAEDEQWAKLRSIVEIAEEVWG